ncbi:hypothetical protein EJ08DRAFT_659590 [Tothia fuscella]|uniref:F-box domain-containing protein n=1 Tax=Tothia fuscella TaxID=1048955 RepID=A0A9P4NV15_9PEZI|nr:hypothetical protein EJ08DRAFT_659590 [Tothia fuscella]
MASSPAIPPNQFDFFALPGEIRNRIYDILYDSVNIQTCFSTTCAVYIRKYNYTPATSLLSFVTSCTQIRTEFPKAYFTSRVFVLHIANLAPFTERLRPSGFALVQSVRISMPVLMYWTGSAWHLVVDAVPLIKLVSQNPYLRSKLSSGSWKVGFGAFGFSQTY